MFDGARKKSRHIFNENVTISHVFRNSRVEKKKYYRAVFCFCLNYLHAYDYRVLVGLRLINKDISVVFLAIIPFMRTKKEVSSANDCAFCEKLCLGALKMSYQYK